MWQDLFMPTTTTTPVPKTPLQLPSALLEEIRVEMARNGVTRTRMALDSGKSLSMTSRILNGSARLTCADAFAFARVLGTPLSDLIHRAETAVDGPPDRPRKVRAA